MRMCTLHRIDSPSGYGAFDVPRRAMALVFVVACVGTAVGNLNEISTPGDACVLSAD
jgi:hypothetical protein